MLSTSLVTFKWDARVTKGVRVYVCVCLGTVCIYYTYSCAFVCAGEKNKNLPPPPLL